MIGKEAADNCAEPCENYQDSLANFDLSASEDELDNAHPGYGIRENTEPAGTNEGTIPNNQRDNQVGIQAEATEAVNEVERSEVVQPGACQQPANEETTMGIQNRGNQDLTGSDSRESSKKKERKCKEEVERTNRKTARRRNASICKAEAVRCRCYQTRRALSCKRSINS